MWWSSARSLKFSLRWEIIFIFFLFDLYRKQNQMGLTVSLWEDWGVNYKRTNFCFIFIKINLFQEISFQHSTYDAFLSSLFKSHHNLLSHFRVWNILMRWNLKNATFPLALMRELSSFTKEIYWKILIFFSSLSSGFRLVGFIVVCVLRKQDLFSLTVEIIDHKFNFCFINKIKFKCFS